MGMLQDSIDTLELDNVYLASPTEFFKWEKKGQTSFKVNIKNIAKIFFTSFSGSWEVDQNQEVLDLENFSR